jgi:hypothetical protein
MTSLNDRLTWPGPEHLVKKDLQYSKTCLNLLGTNFCVQNRQVLGLYRLN